MCDPEICCPITVVKIDCVIHNDAVGGVRRFPFNEQRVGTGVSHYYTGGRIRRNCKDKKLLLLRSYRLKLRTRILIATILLSKENTANYDTNIRYT